MLSYVMKTGELLPIFGISVRGLSGKYPAIVNISRTAGRVGLM